MSPSTPIRDLLELISVVLIGIGVYRKDVLLAVVATFVAVIAVLTTI